jgi:hypothetical protein
MEFLRARYKSFGYAFRGLSVLFRTQGNARIHLLATIGVIAGGLVAELSASEWIGGCGPRDGSGGSYRRDHCVRVEDRVKRSRG